MPARQAALLPALLLLLGPALPGSALAAPADLTSVSDLLTNGQPASSGDLTSLADTPLDPALVDPAIARPDEAGEVLDAGVASWYGPHWSGRRAADGSRFNPEAMTAASATLPLGTRVLVSLEGSARSVVVTITDRLRAASRVIDLSRGAARKIGILGRGTARVILRRG